MRWRRSGRRAMRMVGRAGTPPGAAEVSDGDHAGVGPAFEADAVAAEMAADADVGVAPGEDRQPPAGFVGVEPVPRVRLAPCRAVAAVGVVASLPTRQRPRGGLRDQPYARLVDQVPAQAV